ncbi:MAG: cation:proton antiporter [Alphaproteobacteria bacterium]|jgi:monovalent cation:H+ antiporter-2, CPA2 family|nr:cation:proton antiporter [Alphaproteobacteria bacterium]MBT5390251.1 cation:proton antiporter [Alphaproteobacteria bacterium]MBT5540019.1 cation:proton antiporter [Alphaproteobacteria bacterium]MBT5654537.1 cation:proton antiporter [Alphaproteobacteria bacterium]
MHASSLTQIAVVVLMALLGGMAFSRFKQPAILGYLLAGVLLGPSGFALVENRDSIQILAELGVLLLLFLVGMELNLKSFKTFWHITVGSVICQIVGSLGAMILASYLFGWPIEKAILFGFIIALSSTAVTVKMLEGMGELQTNTGRITIGILIAQDLAFVPMILVIRGFGGGGFDILTITKIAFSIAFLVALIMYLNRNENIKLPFTEQIAKNSELLPLVGLAFCFGAAAIAGFMDLSAAYGAFIAGLILGNSSERKRVVNATHPIQSVLLMVFFLSIGLLMDLSYIWDNLAKVLILLVIITICKTLLNISILHLFKLPWRTSFLSGVMIAQIGEFSFLLASIGTDVGILGEEDGRLVIALTVLSLATSPLWLLSARRIQKLRKATNLSFREFCDIIYAPEMSMLGKTAKVVKKGVKELKQDIKKSP